MAMLEYNVLSLGSKNSTVYVFKQMVDSRLGYNTNSKGRHIAELDKELYDNAISLPEAALVSFDYIQDESKYQYGTFKGGNAYKSFDGQVDTSRQVKPQSGWIIRDNSSDKFCLFSSGSKSIIISLSDFELTPIVEDFTPLFNKLMETNKRDTGIINDILNTFSLAVSYRFFISDLIINALYMAWLVYMKMYRTVAEFDFLINHLHEPELPKIDFGFKVSWPSDEEDSEEDKSEPAYLPLFPPKEGSKKSTEEYIVPNDPIANNASRMVKEDNIVPEKHEVLDTSNCEAILYAIGDKRSNALYCYQQPDSVSYTASAQYDPMTSRGSQQPLYIYQAANPISMSFTLSFHNDDVALSKLGSIRTLQGIADKAEELTRPWKVNNSVKPKLVHVILPGISEIGYLVSANISYNGDMTGSSPDQYNYNTLQIGFELSIVKEVKLRSLKSNKQDTEAKEEAKKDENNNKEDTNKKYYTEESKKAKATIESSPLQKSSTNELNDAASNTINNI